MRTACIEAAIGVLAPLLIFVAVRAMAPVAGIPVLNADKILPIPIPFNSAFGLCFVPVMLSATMADNKDSNAAKIAMAKAGNNNCRNSSNEGKINNGLSVKNGKCNKGGYGGIPGNN